ncbi:hypothetical protein K4G60_g1854 [Candida parapsilosis]|nr:hypothetical protein K4G60_g1854 [Candida parapsilosis]
MDYENFDNLYDDEDKDDDKDEEKRDASEDPLEPEDVRNLMEYASRLWDEVVKTQSPQGTDDLQELRKSADVDKATIEKNMAALSSQGLRVWDFATRYVDCECDDPEKVESNLTFQSQKNCSLYGCKLCYSAPQNG